jgi:sec-independent protein translocase protein TatC
MPAAPLRHRTPDVEAPAERLRGRMSLIEHLEAFRQMLVRSAVAVGVGMVVAFAFIDRIFTFVFAPTRAMLPAGSSLIYTQPGEAFALYINIALVCGAIIASPAIFYQVWRFAAPALYAREKRFVIPFVALTTIGAVTGAAFSHYVLFPYMIRFFGTFQSADLQFMPQVSFVFGLYLKMLGGTMLMFQMPTFAYFLARIGLITAGLLWAQFRYAILVIFIIAAVITPSADPWTQTLFAAPMIVLYLISMVIAWLAAPRRRAARDR